MRTSWLLLRPKESEPPWVPGVALATLFSVEALASCGVGSARGTFTFGGIWSFLSCGSALDFARNGALMPGESSAMAEWFPLRPWSESISCRYRGAVNQIRKAIPAMWATIDHPIEFAGRSRRGL